MWSYQYKYISGDWVIGSSCRNRSVFFTGKRATVDIGDSVQPQVRTAVWGETTVCFPFQPQVQSVFLNPLLSPKFNTRAYLNTENHDLSLTKCFFLPQSNQIVTKVLTHHKSDERTRLNCRCCRRTPTHRARLHQADCPECAARVYRCRSSFSSQVKLHGL